MKDRKEIKKIFENKINDVEIGLNTIHLFKKNEIDEAQIGYRTNQDGIKIKEWIGDNYYVIGEDSMCGDPIIVDVIKKELPVYTMFHDDWNTMRLIAESLDEYINILEKIKNTNLKDKEECDNLLMEINGITSPKAYSYLEDLITGAYEFYNDID